MRINDIIQLDVIGINSEGDGIGRYNGIVVFVPLATKGDVITAQITEQKKSFARAKLIKIMEPSAQRIAPACKYFETCGGCSLQMLAQNEQKNLKASNVQDMFKKVGKIAIGEIEVWEGEPFQYRNRVQWHCQNGRLGFFNASSYQLVCPSECLLLPDIFNRIYTFLNKQKLPEGLMHIALQTDEKADKVMLVFCAAYDKQEYNLLTKILCEEFPALCSVFLNINDNPSFLYSRKFIKLAGVRELAVQLCGKKFMLYPGAFLQINFKGCEVLYNKVLTLAHLEKSDKVWDIYCGIGTITQLLADQAAFVLGVEECWSAVDAAGQNCLQNHIENIEFINGKAEEVLPRLAAKGENPSVVVLDPPRAGCGKTVLDAILEVKPQRIIYISCNPATLARDCATLGSVYSIKHIEAIDMFPQTAHVETITLLVQK